MSGKASKRARQQAKGTVGRSTRHPAPLTYWHGGMPGLKPGDHLLPMTTLLGLPARARLRNEVLADVDMSWVAMSTDRDLAEGFAERWSYQLFQRYRSQLANAPDPWHQAAGLKGGSLYRVEPRGATSPDPDIPEVSLRARRAVIVAVEIERLPYTSQIRLSGLRRMFWDDGAPMYTEDGYAHPSALAVELGVTPSDLRYLGFGPHSEDIDHASVAVVQRLGKTAELRRRMRG